MTVLTSLSSLKSSKITTHKLSEIIEPYEPFETLEETLLKQNFPIMSIKPLERSLNLIECVARFPAPCFANVQKLAIYENSSLKGLDLDSKQL